VIAAAYKVEDGSEVQQAKVPHATRKTRKDSYKTVAKRVSQACAEAMKRSNSPTTDARPPAKKKKN